MGTKEEEYHKELEANRNAERSETPPPEYEPPSYSRSESGVASGVASGSGSSSQQPNSSQPQKGIASTMGAAVKRDLLGRLSTPQEAGLIGSALSVPFAAVGGLLSLPGTLIDAGMKHKSDKKRADPSTSSSSDKGKGKDRKRRDSASSVSTASSSSSDSHGDNSDPRRRDLRLQQRLERRQLRRSQRQEYRQMRWDAKGKRRGF